MYRAILTVIKARLRKPSFSSMAHTKYSISKVPAAAVRGAQGTKYS